MDVHRTGHVIRLVYRAERIAVFERMRPKNHLEVGIISETCVLPSATLLVRVRNRESGLKYAFKFLRA